MYPTGVVPTTDPLGVKLRASTDCTRVLTNAPCGKAVDTGPASRWNTGARSSGFAFAGSLANGLFE